MIAFSSPKIAVQSYLGDMILKFHSSGAAKDRDDLLKFLQKALDRKAWEVQARLHQQKKSSEALAKRKVGVVSKHKSILIIQLGRDVFDLTAIIIIIIQIQLPGCHYDQE